MDIEALAATLRSRPNWAQLTASERTTLCCQEYVERGERIPGWTTIREVIGKGSSGDINRAKQAFLVDHAEQVRLFSGAVDGLPQDLAPHVRAFWVASLQVARDGLSDFEAKCRDETRRATADRDSALQQRAEAVERADRMAAELAGVRQVVATQEAALTAERASREQAERMFETTRSELAGQRTQLEAALERARQEVDAAVRRLEGVEKHMLMEVDRVKLEAQGRIETLESRLSTLTAERRTEQARWSVQLRELREQLVAFERENAVLTKERDGLAAQLSSVHREAQRLADENGKLLSMVGDTSAPRGRREPLVRRRR